MRVLKENEERDEAGRWERRRRENGRDGPDDVRSRREATKGLRARPETRQ
jgi:hypothetical protein